MLQRYKKLKPLTLTGTEYPDGKLSFKGRYIMWDNKSKETPVIIFNSLIDILIAPEFTSQSIQECVDYSLNNDTQIILGKWFSAIQITGG